MLIEETLTRTIIGAAIEVHKALGPGLLESAYEQCLCHELNLRGLAFQRQVSLPAVYKSTKLASAYSVDLVVEGRALVELKCVTRLLPVHEAQLQTYLRFSGKRVGLLFNFNVPVLRDGIIRRVL